jgi:hypothetical protein
VSREEAFLFFPPITVPYVQVQLEAPSVPETYVPCDQWILFGSLPVECQAPRRRMMPCLLGRGNWVALLPYHYYLMLQQFALQYYLNMVAQGFLFWFHDLDYGWLVYPGMHPGCLHRWQLAYAEYHIHWHATVELHLE